VIEWFSTACCLYGARSKNEITHYAGLGYLKTERNPTATAHAAIGIGALTTGFSWAGSWFWGNCCKAKLYSLL
jgi:hypothetical protein